MHEAVESFDQDDMPLGMLVDELRRPFTVADPHLNVAALLDSLLSRALP